MSKLDLDAKEMLADSLITTAMILGGKKIDLPPSVPALLSRRWTVFSIPSSTTDNYFYFVVGSKRDGWLCSCVGAQAHGYCRHVKAVELMWESIAADRKRKRTSAKRTGGSPDGAKRSQDVRGRSPRYKGRRGK